MGTQKSKPRIVDAKESPQQIRGLEVIRKRLVSAREVYAKGGENLLRTFNDHVHPVVNEGIKSGLIDPKVLGDQKLVDKEEYVENLTILDVLLWHVFKNSSIVPRDCLRDPNEDMYKHMYITSFEEAHATFMLLRELDNQPGYNGQAYLQALFPNEGQKKPNVAMLARLIDFGSLADEGIFAYVSSEGLEVSINIPSDEEWEEIKHNLAQSGLALWASLADRLGLSELVRKIKEFSVRKLYPGIWEYTQYEMSRVSEKVEKSNKIIEEITAELKRELEKNGIVAKVMPRKGGKSPASLGLKAKARTERMIRSAIGRIGYWSSLEVSLDIINPKKSILADRDLAELAIEFSPLRGLNAGIWFDDKRNILRLQVGPNEYDLHTELSMGLDTPFILCDVEKVTNDLVAGRIIISGYKKKKEKEEKTSEMVLIKATYEAEEILAGCIRRVLRKHGIATFGSEVTDYIKKPKKTGYRAIHVDTGAEDIISFEWQIMTNRMYVYSKEGGAAHCLYKATEGLTDKQKEVLIGVKEIILSAKKGGDPVDIREENQVTFKVRIGKKETRVQLPEGRLIMDALVDAGVELAKVASLEIDGKGVKLLEDHGLKGPTTIEVKYTNKEEDLLIRSRLARQMLEICHGQVTRKQLRDIISGNGRKK